MLDKFGAGYLGAPRGSRPHLGVDYITQPGQPVYAPCDMYVERLSYPYVGDTSLRGIAFNAQINGVNGSGRMWYFEPDSSVIGNEVAEGQLLGYASSLQEKYPGITNHVHLQFATSEKIPGLNHIVYNGKFYNEI